jgi:SPP1 family predicted phage head-tail adaptor
MNIGKLRHRVTLENPGDPVSDGDGGFTQTWIPVGTPRMSASVEPATVRSLEEIGANTVTSLASHVVTLRYMRGVTTKTRLTFHDGSIDRLMSVTKPPHDPDERHVQINLECVEIVA